LEKHALPFEGRGIKEEKGGRLNSHPVCYPKHRDYSAEIGRGSNPQLYGGIARCVLMQGVAQLLPQTRGLLGLTPLAPPDLLRIDAVAIDNSLVNDAIEGTPGAERIS
jgi:hypothetical protein